MQTPMRAHEAPRTPLRLHAAPQASPMQSLMRAHEAPRTFLRLHGPSWAFTLRALRFHAPSCASTHPQLRRIIRGAAHGPQGRSHAPPCTPMRTHALSPVPCRTRCCTWPTRPQPCTPMRPPCTPMRPPCTLTRAVSYEVLHLAHKAAAMRPPCTPTRPHAPPCTPIHAHPRRVVRGAALSSQGLGHAPQRVCEGVVRHGPAVAEDDVRSL